MSTPEQIEKFKKEDARRLTEYLAERHHIGPQMYCPKCGALRSTSSSTSRYAKNVYFFCSVCHIFVSVEEK